MKIKHVVVTLYEGHCPICNDYQNSQLSSEYIDKECDRCKHKKVEEALVHKDIVIYSIEGNEIEGYRIYIKSKEKIYRIEAKDFKEIL